MRRPEVAAAVTALVGTWEGQGNGDYPTIEPFRYREVTRIGEHPDHPALHYEQRTWKLTSDGEEVSHWETGLLRISSDGSATLHNAQGGRTETMRGTWFKDGQGWVVELVGTGYSGDERVVASHRSVRFDGADLSYEMRMETINNPELTLHLKARLAKVRS